MKSNCLFEALKAKINDPQNTTIYKRGSWLCFFKQWPHFYWYDKPSDKQYHYCQKDEPLTWLKQIWYEGDIIERRGQSDAGFD